MTSKYSWPWHKVNITCQSHRRGGAHVIRMLLVFSHAFRRFCIVGQQKSKKGFNVDNSNHTIYIVRYKHDEKNPNK